MTDSIKISLDTEGIEELLRVNDELMERNRNLEQQVDINKDDRKFVKWFAVISGVLNVLMIWVVAFKAVTR